VSANLDPEEFDLASQVYEISRDLRSLSRRLRRGEDLKDFIQEVRLRTLQFMQAQAAKKEPVRDLRKVIITVALNLIRDQYREKDHVVCDSDRMDAESRDESIEADPERSVFSGQILSWIERRLSKRNFEIVMRKYLLKQSLKEIAKALGIPVSSVKKYLKLSRDQLREARKDI